MNRDKIVTGKLYNLCDLNGRRVKGVSLLVSNNDEEYLFRRDLSISLKKKYQLYQTSISLQNYIYSIDDQNSTVTGKMLFIAIISGVIVRSFVSKSVMLGETNLPFNLYNGLINMLQIALLLLFIFYLISIYRTRKIKKIVTDLGGDMKHIGKIESCDYIFKTKKGMEFW